MVAGAASFLEFVLSKLRKKLSGSPPKLGLSNHLKGVAEVPPRASGLLGPEFEFRYVTPQRWRRKTQKGSLQIKGLEDGSCVWFGGGFGGGLCGVFLFFFLKEAWKDWKYLT